MPKENKRRGRREEKKRKRHEDEELGAFSKRSKIQNEDWEQDEIKLDDEEGLSYQDNSVGNGQQNQEFFGLLDDEEQAYFKRAAQMLELNEFVSGSTEERDAFIAGVWKECKDKELKVASSQSCSRLMEKLIQYATTEQLNSLFQSFNGHFTYLVQHRFASHCCEALFQKAAPLVTDELLTPFEIVTSENQNNAASTESLFLGAVAELKGNFGYLMTDAFASHSVRILLLILSGQPLASQSTQLLLQSKKKEMKPKNVKVEDSASRAVPASFQESLEGIIEDTVGSLDTNYLRALATHPLGNPVLQLLLEIEFSTARKEKKEGYSLFYQLIPEPSISDGTESARFVRGLLFDPIGSHLLETIIRHCPGKVFKPIWNEQLRPKLLSMIKNDSSIHILSRAIERLSPEDLQATANEILPEIPAVLERMQYSTIKLLVERMLVRNLDSRPILEAVSEYYAKSGIGARLIVTNEGKETEEERLSAGEPKDPARQRLSIFFQAMLEHPGSVRKLLLDSFSEMTTQELAHIGKDKYATFVLQQSLAVGDKIYRRVLVQKLSTIVLQLVLDDSGSHVLDSIWRATVDLQFLREKVAHQLASYEKEIRDSYSGRFVWRSWMMDLFTRRKQSWVEKSKQADYLANAKSQSVSSSRQEAIPKTGIAAARDRFAARKGSHKTGINHGRPPQQAAVK